MTNKTERKKELCVCNHSTKPGSTIMVDSFNPLVCAICHKELPFHIFSSPQEPSGDVSEEKIFEILERMCEAENCPGHRKQAHAIHALLPKRLEDEVHKAILKERNRTITPESLTPFEARRVCKKWAEEFGYVKRLDITRTDGFYPCCDTSHKEGKPCPIHKPTPANDKEMR